MYRFLNALSKYTIINFQDYRAFLQSNAEQHRRNAVYFGVTLVAIMVFVGDQALPVLLSDPASFQFFEMSYQSIFVDFLFVYAALLLGLIFYKGPYREYLPGAQMCAALFMTFMLGYLDVISGQSITAFVLGVLFFASFQPMHLLLAAFFYPAYFYGFYHLTEKAGAFAPYATEYVPLIGLTIAVALVTELTRHRRYRDGLFIQKQIKQMEAALEFRAQAISRVSHEFKTPLNAIIGFADIMINQKVAKVDPESVGEYAGFISQSGRHLLELVDNILLLNKKNAHKLNVIHADVDLAELIAEVMPVVELDASMKKLALHSDVDTDVSHVLSDRMLLKQILFNALSNAVKYTPDNGAVHIALFMHKSELILEIKDNGKGMTPDELAHAKEPFNQVESTLAGSVGGTGLGIPIMIELAESLDIDFNIMSDKNKGTVVSLIFGKDILCEKIIEDDRSKNEHLMLA